MWNDFDGLYEFHGHSCPMSTLGARLALAAMRELGVGKADQFIIEARYFTNNCGLDGVQYVSGCTLGNGNLSYEESGRSELKMAMRDGSRGVTVAITEAAVARFMEHKTLRSEVETAVKRREAPDRIATLKEELESKFRALTKWVQSAPEGELIAVKAEG